MINFKEAFEQAVEYIEDDVGCCPACYANVLSSDKCTPCLMQFSDNRQVEYDKSRSIKCWKEIFVNKSEVFGMKLDLKNSIPVEVLKSEYKACKLANQCDMGSRYDIEKARAIKIVLEWFKTPSYQDRLYSCGIKETQEREETENE